ncbi:MAG: DUF4293 domain-containing protein [Bacteroidales bacterium]|nr:DUF4293 domain-containing protein [Bacteroidales bacterium]
MWQRIQTLYMLVAAVITGLGAAFVARLPFIVLFVTGCLANLLPIFMFRHRMLQMRILIFGACVLLGLQIWMAFDYFSADAAVKFNYSMVAPAVAVILDVLAVRGVISDELVVRSAGRLRAAKRNRK